MNEEIVIIGKLMDESNGYLVLAYPSASGIREARIPTDAVSRREHITDGRIAVLVKDIGDYSTGLQFAGRGAPYHVTAEHIRIVGAMEYGEELSEEDYDDEVPIVNSENAPSIILTGEEGTAPVVIDSEVWGQGLFAGGRRATETDWRFTPIKRPAFVFQNEGGGGMAPTLSPVTDVTGAHEAYHIFNPTYANDRRPMGAYLGTFGSGYYPLPYEVGYNPILKKSEEFGWKASVTAYDEGKRARLDCDVSQAGHTKRITADRMRGLGSHFDQDLTLPMVDDLKGLYRYGFTIHNSLDGSSAFRLQATAMRAACSNMQILDVAKANVLSLKHTYSTMANYEWDDLADKVNDTIVVAQQELVNVEMLKNISCSKDLLERIMTLSEKRGLITKPQLVRDDAGDVTSINRGYMWKVLGHGWTHPGESWVSVKPKDAGSLFHAYNILTGAITHKPVYNEAKKQPLTGNTLSFRTMDKRLKTTHDLFMNVGSKVVTGYSKEHGSIGHDDLNDLMNFSMETNVLEDVPLFSEVLY